MQKTMRAVRVHEWGGPDRLRYEEGVPIPAPGPGDVLIRVRAAGVNPVDWKAREGRVEGLWPHTLPLVLGWDASGTVEAVGEGVTAFAPGDEVFAHIDVARDGSYAEYTVCGQEGVAQKPGTLTHVEAASLPIVAETAWQSLFEIGGLSAGQTVLVHAAAGGVGSMAVQFARWKGARVIGTASARNHEFVRSLGADEVIDYTATRFEEAVPAQGVDLVLDTIGGDTQARTWRLLRPGGHLIAVASGADEEAAARHGVKGSWMLARPDGRDLSAVADLIVSGAVRTTVSEVFPLAEARRAHELLQTGHARGKVVLEVA